MEDQPSKQLRTKIVVAVFALLLLTVVTATAVHPVYADDDDCDDNDDCDDCQLSVSGSISVCASGGVQIDP